MHAVTRTMTITTPTEMSAVMTAVAALVTMATIVLAHLVLVDGSHPEAAVAVVAVVVMMTLIPLRLSPALSV